MNPLTGTGSNWYANLPGVGNNPVSHKQFVDRLQHARPTDLTRQQEKDAEPLPTDALDIRWQPSEPVQPSADQKAPAERDVSGDAPPDSGGLAVQRDLQQARQRFGASLGGPPLGVQSNAEGLFGPGGDVPTTLLDRRSPPPSGTPAVFQPLDYRTLLGTGDTDAAVFGPQTDTAMPTAAKWALGLGIGATALTALSAFAMPFGFGMGMPFGFGMSMFNPLMSFVPMMTTMSTTLMMAQMMMMPPMSFPSMGYPPTGMPPPYGAPPPGPIGPRPGVVGRAPLHDAVSELVDGKTAELTDEEKQKLDELPPERRKMFEDLWTRFEGKDIRFPSSRLQASVNEHLGQLLRSGKLDTTDTKGTDLLDNLTRLSRQEMGEGIDAAAVTAQAIGEVASPARTMTQGNHGTCAAATVQYMMARKNPSEFVRVAAGLLGKEGQVPLANGQMATRIADSVAEDRSGRTALDRIMQASFMAAAAEGSNIGEYSNEQDGFVVQVPRPFMTGVNPFSWGPFQSTLGPQDFGQGAQGGMVVQSGLDPEQVRRLAEATSGEGYVEIFRQGFGDPHQALNQMSGILQDSQEPLPVSMQWDGGGHRVLVTDVKEGRVYFRNPWGERREGERDEKLWGVDHQVGEGGIESIPVHDFAMRMKSVIAPHSTMGGPAPLRRGGQTA